MMRELIPCFTEWYLGPKWMPERFRKTLPFAVEFRQAAKAHDVSYELGGSERKRRIADRMFLRLCLSACQKMRFPRIFAGIAFSCLYYLAVSVGGPLSFNYYWKRR